MKRLSLATTITLSAVAVAFAAAPGGAVGAKPYQPGSGNVSVTTPAPAATDAAKPYQPGAGNESVTLPPSVNSDVAKPYEPGAGNVSVTPVNLTAQYSPTALNLGVVKAYQSGAATAVLTVTSPSDGTVSAELEPKGPFQVTRMTRYQYGIPAVSGSGGAGTCINGGPASARPRQQLDSVAGGAGLAVTAGDEVEITVSLQPTPDMFR